MKQAGEPARPLIREALQILHRLELSGVGATEVMLNKVLYYEYLFKIFI